MFRFFTCLCLCAVLVLGGLVAPAGADLYGIEIDIGEFYSGIVGEVDDFRLVFEEDDIGGETIVKWEKYSGDMDNRREKIEKDNILRLLCERNEGEFMFMGNDDNEGYRYEGVCVFVWE